MRRTARQAPRQSRGFAMVFALFIVLLLLVIGLAMLSVSQYGASDTRKLEIKQASFDAAEAGLNQAMLTLDNSLGFSSSGSGTLPNGYAFTYSVKNNLLGTNPLPYTDPFTHGSVQVPPARALIVSTGQGPNGERPTTVESIVKDKQSIVTFPNDAIDAGLDIEGNWNHKIGVAGSAPGANDAKIHANHDITATIGFLQGTAGASGTVDTLNSGPGGINQPQVVLPTNQLPGFVADELAVAQAGGPYAMYIPSTGSLPASFNCPSGAPPNGCTIFYDGPLHISGGSTFAFTGKVVLVINGDFTATGNSSLRFQSGSRSLFMVNGNADIGGNGAVGALVWVKGDTTLHGNGNYTGAIVTGGNAIFNGGGSSGGFLYDKSLQGFTINIPGHIVITAFGEY
jgi:Tfp pilus assembly protein PilX